MKKVEMKNGKVVIIQEATKSEAQSMMDYYNLVGGETDFLSFGKNGYVRELKEYEEYLENTRKEENSIILVAKIDDEIVSIASINSSQKARTKHVGTLGIVVAEQYCGFGLGRILMAELIEWARNNGVTKKVSLVTREDNIRAIELYKKLGFVEEGLLKEDTYINGVYYNTLLMGLMI
ncbi:GNAT family N-acetyltransferase [Peribacillus alkalitolerans]|uniref:GNAT family N-acetyltransferase n=1 Tax=Peribacillus alkalitolerans TaxID=1550385 RepID=UPI0013D2E5C7|nr:GNAT family N-acetyltransferase [Peribacillus alkalitolerans]